VFDTQQKYPRTKQLLDTESTASGVYLPELDDPEHCNAFASTAWETAILHQHFHPFVSQFLKYVISDDPLPAALASKSAVDLLQDYDPRYES